MSGRPVVSVVVPTRGRPGALKRCLESLMRQDYPTDAFEIVVIDDGSPQPVTLPEFGSGVSVTLSRQTQGGPAAARNHGLEHARGEYVAFIDDDCEASPDWLSELVGTLQGTELVTTIAGGMRIDEYLPTRIFELVVHTLDLGRALGVTLDVPGRPAASVLGLISELAIGDGLAGPLVLATTGRGALPDGFSVL